LYNDVNQIDINALPNAFVLKGTHGSGYNIIVPNKAELNWEVAKKKLRKYMSRNYSDRCKELVYKTIEPRIIAEKYLDSFETGNIIDYKFQCFHGEPKYVLVKTLVGKTYKKAFYDLNWNKLKPDASTKNYLKKDIVKPSNFEEMIDIARKLAKGFIYIRVDLYSIGEKIYFGELTFFPNGAVQRIIIERLNKEFGDLMTLPNTKKPNLA
jgi:hypothetical protein